MKPSRSWLFPDAGGNWEGGTTDSSGQRWIHVPWRGWEPMATRPFLRPALMAGGDDDSFIGDCGHLTTLMSALVATVVAMWRHRHELKSLFQNVTEVNK